MNFGPWGTFADESYAPQAERARNVVVGAVGPDSSRLLNFLLADNPLRTGDRVCASLTVRVADI